jgi:hypothetical protein
MLASSIPDQPSPGTMVPVLPAAQLEVIWMKVGSTATRGHRLMVT